MRILLVNISFSYKFQSGINPVLFRTYEILKEQGHDVYIFSDDIRPFYDENYKYTNYFCKATPFLTKQNTITDLKLIIKSIYNKEAEIKISKLLKEIKPDLVHIHSTLDLSFSILKPIKEKKIPIIYTFHDMSLLCPASLYSKNTENCNLCKGYNLFSCIKKKCVNGKYLISSIIAMKGIAERYLGALKDIDLYLTVSDASKNYAVNMNIDENKIKVLPNFINKEIMNNSIPDYSKNTKYFLYAGGSSKIKGIDTLLNTIKQLPENIEFHLAGIGNFKDINDFIIRNKLKNIKIKGQLSFKELQEEYKNCIAVIIPSEWFETFGMINIEAAVYGKPSISSDMGGLPEVVENNKTGLIFEAGNIESLKECILKYWNNRDLVIEHGKNANEKVKKVYCEDRYFKELKKIYEDVLNNKQIIKTID